jgi:hypothetical protein
MPSQTWTTSYGYRTMITSPFTLADAAAWFEDMQRAVGAPHPFSQLIDLRDSRTSSEDDAGVIGTAMRWARHQGLVRSAVVVSSVVTTLKINRLARAAGVYEGERYVDASGDPHWEAKALAWIEQGIEPEA